MRFIGKWLVWIGGLAFLYQSLRPLAERWLRSYETGEPLGYSREEWLMQFALPVFVLGVICAAALPDLNRRRERKKKSAPPLAPPPPPPVPPPAEPPAAAPVLPADSTPPSAL